MKEYSRRSIRIQYTRARVLLVFEPRHFARVSEPLHTNRLDRGIGHHLQRCVPRMVAIVIRVVAGGVVAADHRPARVVGLILIAAVQCVRVEEQGVARLHLDVDQLQPLRQLVHAFAVGPSLLALRALGFDPQREQIATVEPDPARALRFDSMLPNFRGLAALTKERRV